MSRKEVTLLSTREPYPKPLMALSRRFRSCTSVWCSRHAGTAVHLTKIDVELSSIRHDQNVLYFLFVNTWRIEVSGEVFKLSSESKHLGLLFQLVGQLKQFAPDLPVSAAHTTLTFLFETEDINLPDSSDHDHKKTALTLAERNIIRGTDEERGNMMEATPLRRARSLDSNLARVSSLDDDLRRSNSWENVIFSASPEESPVGAKVGEVLEQAERLGDKLTDSIEDTVDLAQVQRDEREFVAARRATLLGGRHDGAALGAITGVCFSGGM